MNDILLSRKEAAARMGISLVTFDRNYKKCGLPYIVIGRSVKVPKKELEAWIKKNTKTATEQK